MTAASQPPSTVNIAPPGPERVYYRVLPGTDVVPVGDDLLLASDGVTLRLEGESAALFRDSVVPLLDGTRSLAEVAADLPGLAPDDLRPHLDALVDARVLGRHDSPAPPDSAATAPFLRFMESTGLSSERGAERLAAVRVAVFGLEGPGAHVAAALAASGVGTIVLVDPYPGEPGNLPLMGPAPAHRSGVSRQQLVSDALAGVAPGVTIETGGDGTLDRASAEALCTGCDLVIGCFDKGFSATNVWINDACVANGVPAIYAQLRGPIAWVGPLVVPDETACYLCWRMRAIACDEDFMASMAIEELLDGQRRPALHERGAIPALAPMVGGMVALEAVKFLLGLGRDALAGHVQEVDALLGRTESHAVLAVADCPVCKKKSLLGPTLPSLT